ncbi:MAG: alanine racemase [Deltaproteobacteria bacterium]|nr:alanine racemase [Deltaproteobacteria bacterium]
MLQTGRLEYSDWIRSLEGVALPAALVDLDALERNADRIAAPVRASGKRLRLATKSLRCVRVASHLRERLEDIYGGLMCLTVAEAAFLADRGFDDLLIAYPTMQRADLVALAALTRAGRTVRLVVDSAEHVRAMSDVSHAEGVTLRAVIDIDMSYRPFGTATHLGVRRSPIRTGAEAIAIAREAQRAGGVIVDALMGYEAQVAGMGEASPFTPLTNPVKAWIKRRSIPDVASRRARIASELRAAGVNVALFNGGGTGSLATTSNEDVVTEVTAGSGFFCPHLFDYYAGTRLEPAAFFALQIVRFPAPGIVTCQGGGYVASGEAGRDRLPVPHLPRGLSLLGVEGAGETQTPLRWPASAGEARLGAPVIFRHAKAGELMERFNEIVLVRGGRVVDRVPTYRGEGFAFL